ncbi:ubiquitin carboxyl-terminal hydrolase 3-like isoform X1 [Centruroides sculpturatus]|uniref:ubiquitin carboxyl-terminal hydrolase 3-like isoform X1 n=2 Tax=Centruroides sculpturatus TaxID=218467 RepID=UPI000C6D0B76|nr:ubiquitin carboxyl-terminal hydrolase 3-like isoform X1 [Centruroides sculpturatus]
MECPHLDDCVKITVPPQIKESDPYEWYCFECKIKKSPWMCVQCGIVNCGRYVNGHAKAHHEANEEHMVCMDCINYAAYCYVCDDFVVNDTKSGGLDQLRERLQEFNNLDSQKRLKRQNNVSSGTENARRKKSKKGNGNKSYCKTRISGLRNLGNTCFMNAVLQSLSNIQQFSCYFKQLPSLEPKVHKNGRKNNHARKCNGGDEILLAEELRKTLISLWQGSKTAISPESLFAVIWKVVPRFRGYQQQDAHEFLRYMLDRLHMELLNILSYPAHSNSIFIGPKGKATIVTTIFGGILQNEVTCLVCGTESKKHDPFLDLSLDIPQTLMNKTKLKEEETSLVHLSDCLSSFTELEELADSELYHCHTCKGKQRSTKRFWIRRLPNVLCLHLKRFRWNTYFRTKLDTYVKFPIKGLDMNKFMLSNMHETRGTSGGSTLYDLAAVIVHHGSGVGSGHYTAYATHEGCWHHFNDSTVTLSDEETVANCKAYILFYIRREVNLTPFSL